MKVVIYISPPKLGDAAKEFEMQLPAIGVAGTYTIFSNTVDFFDQFLPYPVAQVLVGGVWSASQFLRIMLPSHRSGHRTPSTLSLILLLLSQDSCVKDGG
jgi:hypothetical protein